MAFFIGLGIRVLGYFTYVCAVEKIFGVENRELRPVNFKTVWAVFR